jgi:hypothetical protein
MSKKVTKEEYYTKCKDLLDQGFEILSEFGNMHDTMEYKCPKGHKFTRIAKDFIRYKTCPYCTGKHQYTTEEFKEKVKELSNGEVDLIGTYINTKEKTEFKCNKCGNIFTLSPSNFINGERCSYCKKEGFKALAFQNAQRSLEEHSKNYKSVLKELTKGTYISLTPYVGKRENIAYKHVICGNMFINNPDYFKSCFNRGYEPCPYCKKHKDVSNKEKDLQEFIKSFYTKKIIFNDRTILKGNKELDIYLPEDHLAIEFDGLYWHSEEASNGKCNKWYHYNKTKECEDKGIRLLHIFEDDWENHNKQIKSKIKYILHYSSDLPKVRASKCYIKEIPHQVKDKFLNTHHIQGHDGGTSVNLGLFNKETKKLMAVMTFTKLNNKSSKENDYNLSRFASHNKYIINGAFSKLLKYFLENYITDDIYTFADRTWSVGNLYDTNNFEVVDYVTPDYSYYNKTEHNLGRQHKFNFRKANIKRRFPEIYDDSKTEKQMMQEAGYVRVWNCGLIKYRLKK